MYTCLSMLQAPIKSKHIPQRSWNTSPYIVLKVLYTASHNKCCIGAENQSTWRLSQLEINREKRCIERIKVRWVWCADVNFHHCFSSSASEIANLYGENSRNKQGRGRRWGSAPHPELRTHSACQYSLSCCIFYEKNPVAYYNIYRHLKIAKRVFLLLGSVTFAYQPWHRFLFHIS